MHNTQARHERNALINKQRWELRMSIPQIARLHDLSPTRIVHITEPAKANSAKYKYSKKPDPALQNSMGADELCRMLEELHLSQYGWAKYMGWVPTTVNRWATGKAPVPTHARRFLELLLAYKRDTKLVRSLHLEDLEGS